jgi:putative pyruvate formate lyase activating enzyme
MCIFEVVTSDCQWINLILIKMKQFSRRQFMKKMLAMPAFMFIPASLLFSHSNAFRSTSKKRIMAHASKGAAFEPGYLALHQNGELKARGEALYEMMRLCRLCPRECETDRLLGRRGECKANADLEISSFHPHFGEEKELVGTHGSGTIFFTNCSLLCVFCINYDISHFGRGNRSSIRELANMMLNLQRRGCHNINLVTPTHYSPHILLALDQAASRGLRLPVVYNTCGWEKMDVLQMLDGIVDVYLADYKYADPEAGKKYSAGASSYPEITQKALLEMHRQTGVALADPETGLINRGLMIRHLVMPNNVSRSDQVVRWIAANLPKDTYVNIMSQYMPMHQAFDYPEIARRITSSEYNNVVTIARQAGLTNLRLQR